VSGRAAKRGIVAYPASIPSEIEQGIRECYEAHRIGARDLPHGPPGLEAIVAAPGFALPAQIIERLPTSVGLIASYSVGVDHIDLAAAARRGIRVTNTPDVLTDATADIAMLLILAACRGASRAERELRAGRWRGISMDQMPGVDLAGRTLGIYGFGRIGQATARRARAFGMRVIYHGPKRRVEDEAIGARFEPDRAAFLAATDVLSLHAPLTPATRRFVCRETLAALRPGSIVINTARGGLVDDEALIEALASGHLRAAGLDVYEGEPQLHPGYLGLENVTLLPHIGSATRETRLAMGRKVLANLEAHFAGRSLPDPVA
jgi:glyoxylate reductase